ncbi:hypothetical protein NMY25_001925 [Wohlfahrtiimonas chitiniclastica]|nr:hypothetical protein [Wohlfahrtiimonas chitiniclastica]
MKKLIVPTNSVMLNQVSMDIYLIASGKSDVALGIGNSIVIIKNVIKYKINRYTNNNKMERFLGSSLIMYLPVKIPLKGGSIFR